MFGQICFLKVRLKVNYVTQVAHCGYIYMSTHLGQIKFKTLDWDLPRSGDFVYTADVKSALFKKYFVSQKVVFNIYCIYVCLITKQGLLRGRIFHNITIIHEICTMFRGVW